MNLQLTHNDFDSDEIHTIYFKKNKLFEGTFHDLMRLLSDNSHDNITRSEPISNEPIDKDSSYLECPECGEHTDLRRDDHDHQKYHCLCCRASFVRMGQ
jgi:hypothetical protein